MPALSCLGLCEASCGEHIDASTAECRRLLNAGVDLDDPLVELTPQRASLEQTVVQLTAAATDFPRNGYCAGRIDGQLTIWAPIG
ncbi:hypothetical protein [Kineococcus aurantiacus]|uniref:Uncharacterized protein n=1 Tax=Kineococcus aurantiacus TaxID=37633 RepID=A0A7Y9DQL4_9ACTN|nr:hypothetical protein [Kineococcus aurantiacus]NYD25017.1 hypothetical protein [Kineococcus aurantiacus]